MKRIHRGFRLGVLAVLVLLLVYLLWGRGKDGLEEMTSFGTNPGQLRMYKYVPAGLPAGAPLVVALHGCDQDAKKFSRDTGWNSLADRFRFAVLYPETGRSNNPMKCWNWFRPQDQIRDGGEAHSVRQMVDAMIAAHHLDRKRVFATGLSAGGAMTNVLLAVYPDVFAGGAPMAGVAYRCASSATTAVGCMNGSRTLDEKQLLDGVRSGFAGFSGSYPVVSIWQGTADLIVNPVNAREIARQWAGVHGADFQNVETEVVQGSEHLLYRDSRGRAVVEIWRIHGMGHGVSVDPDASRGAGGGAVGTYSFDRDIWSSYLVAKFWGLIHDGGGPGGLPGVPVEVKGDRNPREDQ